MSLTLYTWQYCPFAQRSRIALEVKNVEHETYELDITQKPYPDWFMKLSPNGKVPTLVHNDRPLYESQVISEYVDEVFDGPRLLPEDPYQRAISRLLINYGEDNLIPVLYRLLRSQDEARDKELKEEALEHWRWFNERLDEFGSDSGLLFDEPTLADYSFGPFFQRWKLVEYYRYFEVPKTDEYARVRSWREAAEALKVVRDTAPPSEELIKVYADYARDHDNAKIPPGRDISSFDTQAWPVKERPMPPRGLRLQDEGQNLSERGAHEERHNQRCHVFILKTGRINLRSKPLLDPPIDTGSRYAQRSYNQGNINGPVCWSPIHVHLQQNLNQEESEKKRRYRYRKTQMFYYSGTNKQNQHTRDNCLYKSHFTFLALSDMPRTPVARHKAY